jgi:hypothetical protein
MSHMTDYLENAIANAVVGGTNYTAPANVYVALYSVAPTESTSGTEVTGNGYSRKEVTFSVANGVATSTGNITFSASAGNSFTANAVAVVDASTSGNILFTRGVNTLTAEDGINIVFETGDITITFD